MLILNVDDDRDDREFFSDAIKAVNPETPCVLFKSGDELLNFLGNSQAAPDYIFIDINMPRMNGYECAQQVKSNYLSGDTQIVMYSTAFNPADVVRFDKEGFKYMVKQNSLSDLIRSLKKVITTPVYL